MKQPVCERISRIWKNQAIKILQKQSTQKEIWQVKKQACLKVWKAKPTHFENLDEDLQTTILEHKKKKTVTKLDLVSLEKQYWMKAISYLQINEIGAAADQGWELCFT